jgi:hypothetical protein
MTTEEVHLRCLGFAVYLARLAGVYGDIKKVVEIETELYNHIVGQEKKPDPVVEPPLGVRRAGRPRSDKSKSK